MKPKKSHVYFLIIAIVTIIYCIDIFQVEEQFKTFCSTMSLTPEDVEKRKEFCHYLHEMLRPYFPNFRLHLFGSSINGLGFKGCDVDISIQTIFDGKVCKILYNLLPNCY